MQAKPENHSLFFSVCQMENLCRSLRRVTVEEQTIAVPMSDHQPATAAATSQATVAPARHPQPAAPGFVSVYRKPGKGKCAMPARDITSAVAGSASTVAILPQQGNVTSAEATPLLNIASSATDIAVNTLSAESITSTSSSTHSAPASYIHQSSATTTTTTAFASLFNADIAQEASFNMLSNIRHNTAAATPVVTSEIERARWVRRDNLLGIGQTAEARRRLAQVTRNEERTAVRLAGWSAERVRLEAVVGGKNKSPCLSLCFRNDPG